MAIDTLQRCACAYIGLNEITIKGANEPNIVWGILGEESGVTLQVGDWVQLNSSTGKYEKVENGDTLTSVLVGVIRTLKKQITSTEYNTTGDPAGSLENSVSVSSADWNGAEIYISGGDPIKASTTYLYISGVRTAFVPGTHTGLAAKLHVVPYIGADGTAIDSYVSLHN